MNSKPFGLIQQSTLEAQLPIYWVPVLKSLYKSILSVAQGPTIWVPGLLGAYKHEAVQPHDLRFWVGVEGVGSIAKEHVMLSSEAKQHRAQTLKHRTPGGIWGLWFRIWG